MNANPAPGLELCYARRTQLRRELGPVAEAVFDVIAHRWAGTAVDVAHRQIAEEAGVAKSTVQRAIDALVASGWLKREHHYTDHHQQVNRYLIPAFLTEECGGQGGGQFDHPYISLSSLSTLTRQHPRRGCVGDGGESGGHEQPPDHLLTTALGGLRPPAGSEKQSPEQSPPTTLAPRSQRRSPLEQDPDWPGPWTPVGTPMPSAKGPFLLLLQEFYPQVLWLVMHFEQLVLARDNQIPGRSRAKPKTTVGEKRRQGFFRSACRLLKCHRLAQVVPVIDWLFADCGGDLPEEVTQYPLAHLGAQQLAERTAVDASIPRYFERKITRLAQVIPYLDQLTELMGRSSPSDGRSPERRAPEGDRDHPVQTCPPVATSATLSGEGSLSATVHPVPRPRAGQPMTPRRPRSFDGLTAHRTAQEDHNTSATPFMTPALAGAILRNLPREARMDPALAEALDGYDSPYLRGDFDWLAELIGPTQGITDKAPPSASTAGPQNAQPDRHHPKGTTTPP